MIIEELAVALGLEMNEAAWKAATESISKLKEHLKGLAIAAGIGGAAAALAEMMKKTAEVGERIALTSRQIGISTESLQGLRFAAEESGIGAEELDHSLRHLARAAYEASTVGGAAGAAFYRLGIQAFDPLTGRVRGADELLGDLADRFQRMPDGMQKAALAMQIFGREGAQMVPLLNKGREGIEEMRKEAAHFGAIMDDRAIATSVAFEKSIRHTNTAIAGLGQAIAVPFMRAFRPMLDQFAEWIVTARKFIDQNLPGAIAFVADAFRPLYMGSKLVIDFWRQHLPEIPVWLKAIGLAVAAIELPMTALGSAIALVMQDFGVFLRGGDSAIGRILYWFDGVLERFKQRMKEVGFFEALYEEGERFATWFAKTIVDAIGRATLDAFGGTPPRPAPGQAVINSQPPSNAQGWHNLMSNLATRFGWEQPPPLPMIAGGPSGGMTGPQFSLNIGQINAGAGADGTQIGEALRAVIEPWWEAKWSGMMSDVAAATNR